jgi:hypothetical protein
MEEEESKTNFGSKWTSCFMISSYLSFFAGVIAWGGRALVQATLVVMTPHLAENEDLNIYHNLSFSYNNGTNNISLFSDSVTGYSKSITGQYEFNWSRSLQGFIISSLQFGSLIGSSLGTPIPMWFSPKKVGLVTMLLCALCTALTPTGARIHPAVYMTINVISGISSSVLRLATLQVMSAWAPVQERSLISSLRAQGITAGLTLAYLYAGFIMSTGMS